MRKFVSKLVIILLSFILVFSAGCSFEEEQYNHVYINMVIPDGNFDIDYYRGAAQRFSEYSAEKTYSGGYKGAYVNVILDGENTLKLEKQSYSGYNVYLTNEVNNHYPHAWADGNYVLAIDEVFLTQLDQYSGVTLESKLNPNSLPALKGNRLEYCALPNSSEVVGLTYDANSFSKNGYFLANTSSLNKVSFYSTITDKTYYFTNPTGDNNVEPNDKSLGLDGVSGTADDGLPTNLFEFVALCEKIYWDGRAPFVVSGKDSYKGDYLVQALTTALLGEEEANAIMNLNGKINVVTGFTKEDLFPGFTYSLGQGKIRKPIVQQVELTEETGYYASWSLAKYYAEAFMELSMKMDWWSDTSYDKKASSERTIWEYLVSGYDSNVQEGLMLLESSNWYKELDELGYKQLFKNRYDSLGEGNNRKLCWMSLPTTLDGTGDDAKNRTRQTYQQIAPSFLVLSFDSYKQTSVVEASIDFLKFLSTDNECITYTLSTGIPKDINYNFDNVMLNNLDDYYKSLTQNVLYGDKIYLSSNTLTFKKSPSYFEGGKNDTRFFYYKEVTYYDEETGEEEFVEHKKLFDYFIENRLSSCMDTFLSSVVEKSGWSNIYGGYGEVGEYIDPTNNQAVVLNRLGQ